MSGVKSWKTINYMPSVTRTSNPMQAYSKYKQGNITLTLPFISRL